MNSPSIRPFEEYSIIEKDELRKKGLRVLTTAFKQFKQCRICGWENSNHLWLSQMYSTTDIKWTPLARVRQSNLIQELQKRTLVCAMCRRLHPPLKTRCSRSWNSCLKVEPCIDCEQIHIPGWIYYTSIENSTLTIPIESKRCQVCKPLFDIRVAQAKKLNTQLKLEAGQCCTCMLSVKLDTIAAFDWDHIDRELKSGNVSAMVQDGQSLLQIRQEVSKCRLLCVHCHLDWTRIQLGYNDPIALICEALATAQIRTLNETELDLCDSDSDLDYY